MQVRPWRAALGTLAVALLLFSMTPFAASAQDSRGSTGAVVLLGKVTDSLASASTIEYVSSVRTLDPSGRPVTLFVHAKLRKPGSLRVTVSTTGLDASDALLFVGDADTLTGYDPAQKRVAQKPAASTGEHLTLPFGFASVEPAFATICQMFGPAPLNSLFYGDVHSPMTLVRHGVDVPGALLINAQWTTELVGQERMARLWVDINATTPRRLVLGEVRDGVERASYVEDFSSFTLNPTFPPDTFRWTPPTPTQSVAAAPGNDTATPPKAAPAKPAKSKKPAGKPSHHHTG